MTDEKRRAPTAQTNVVMKCVIRTHARRLRIENATRVSPRSRGRLIATVCS